MWLINITGGSDMTLFEVNEASMLVQEAAHEEANIIFGAVIDDEVPEQELRVTVIATGLDDGRVRRGVPDEGTEATPRPPQDAQLEIENVTSFRPQPAASGAVDVSPGPVASASDPIHEPASSSEELARAGTGFESPFEDEYDTPAFIRRRTDEEDDEDREVPAFLRRAHD